MDPMLDVVWRFRINIPRNFVHYRLEGTTLLLDEIAPMYDRIYDAVNRNFPEWIEKSIWLAGLSKAVVDVL